jgi:hypothetical protein
MNRLQELIGRLKEQSEQQAALPQMLATTRLIEEELAYLAAQPINNVNGSTNGRGTAKIAVMMPSASKNSSAANNQAVNPVANNQVTPENNTQEEYRYNNYNNPGSAKEVKPKDPVSINWSFDPMTETPTLAQQQPPARELNDMIGAGGSSLNDKLKGNVLDLATALNDTPVRDLKKAIGVNDRYVFINELFRGDEVMYERSIKTINGFRILPEAEYWMQRELKVKLGWDENRQATRHFYQLVKRRFS